MTDGPPIPADRAKLVAAKTAWARDRRAPAARPIDPESRRLPPGQHRVRDWPVLDLGTHPNLNPKDWRLSVEGLVASPAVFSVADLEAILRRLKLARHDALIVAIKRDHGLAAQHIHIGGDRIQQNTLFG